MKKIKNPLNQKKYKTSNSVYICAMARPSTYTKEICDTICELIATSSKGIHALCKEHEDLPSERTIMSWLSDKDKREFKEQYRLARLAQADFIADEIIQIADTPVEGKRVEITDKGSKTIIYDMLERSRLMIEARKWKAGKLAPRKYGTPQQVDIGYRLQ